jgi:hypothetical protein
MGVSRGGSLNYARVNGSFALPVHYNDVAYMARGSEKRNKIVSPYTRNGVGLYPQYGYGQSGPAAAGAVTTTASRYVIVPSHEADTDLARYWKMLIGLSTVGIATTRIAGSTSTGPACYATTGNPTSQSAGVTQDVSRLPCNLQHRDLGWRDCGAFYKDVLDEMRRIGADGVIAGSLAMWFPFAVLYADANNSPEIATAARIAGANARRAAVESGVQAVGAVIPGGQAVAALIGLFWGAFASAIKQEPETPAMPVLRWDEPVHSLREDPSHGDQFSRAVTRLSGLFKSSVAAVAARPPAGAPLQAFNLLAWIKQHPLVVAAIAGTLVVGGVALVARRSNPRPRRRNKGRAHRRNAGEMFRVYDKSDPRFLMLTFTSPQEATAYARGTVSRQRFREMWIDVREGGRWRPWTVMPVVTWGRLLQGDE